MLPYVFFFRSKFKSQNVYNPGASGGQRPPWSPYQGFAMDPRPFAEIVWYLLHSRKYLQPKKIVKPLYYK
jgi:hypothetical protein